MDETSDRPDRPEWRVELPHYRFADEHEGGVWLPRELRTLRHLLSIVGGYFWLPCPCCGADFAGYEAGHRHVDQEPSPGGGWISACACRWCDTCPGAEREQADLAARLGVEAEVWLAETGGTVRLLPEGPTPAEWRCGT